MDIRAGDQVFFGGSGWLSRFIAAGTCTWWELITFSWLGISHSETAYRHNGQLKLCGSTTMETEPCDISGKLVRGVQSHPLLERIRNYPGRVWVCRLSKFQRLTGVESKRLTAMVLDKIGMPYDDLGCAICGTKWLKRFWNFNAGKSFCSELSLWFLTQLHRAVTTPGRAGRISPAALARACIDSELFEYELIPLKSDPKSRKLDHE